jgi:hypothetical protein
MARITDLFFLFPAFPGFGDSIGVRQKIFVKIRQRFIDFS